MLGDSKNQKFECHCEILRSKIVAIQSIAKQLINAARRCNGIAKRILSALFLYETVRYNACGVDQKSAIFDWIATT